MERAADRLLYDDEAPRLRRPLVTFETRLRRPRLFFTPLILLFSSLVPAVLAAIILDQYVSVSREVMGAALFAYLAVSLVIALGVSRQDEGGGLGALLPTHLSLTHGLAGLGLVTMFAAMQGTIELPQAEAVAASLPALPMDDPLLELASAYVFAFAALTGLSVASSLLFRFLGFERVVAEEA